MRPKSYRSSAARDRGSFRCRPKRGRAVGLSPVWTLVLLSVMAGTAMAGPAAGSKERDCWTLSNTLATVGHIDDLVARGRHWAEIAPFAGKVRRQLSGALGRRAVTEGVTRVRHVADLLPRGPYEWLNARARARLQTGLKETSEQMNCSQYVSGQVRITRQREAGARPMRAKSLLPPGFLEDYATSLILFAASLLAGIGIIVREMMERRRHRRYLVHIPATLRTGVAEHGVMLRDVSRGGVRIAYPDHVKIEKGARVSITFEGVTVEGRIAWAAGGMAGIAFARPIRLSRVLIAQSRARLQS